MSQQKAISMEPVKEKLRNLKDYMPGGEEFVYNFGKFLADRLNPQLISSGFNVAAELALHDLEQGVDGFSKQPIRNGLEGYPSPVYAALRMQVPDIAKAVCPEEFAKGVKEFYEQVKADMKKRE